jgi:hypothetical protein
LNIALRPRATLDLGRFVFDFAAATQMALILENISVTIAVHSTPVERIPCDWPRPQMCGSAKEVRALLDQSFRSQTRLLHKLRKQWWGDDAHGRIDAGRRRLIIRSVSAKQRPRRRPPK